LNDINGLVASSFFAFFKVFLAILFPPDQDASFAEARSVICKSSANVHHNPRRGPAPVFAPFLAIPRPARVEYFNTPHHFSTLPASRSRFGARTMSPSTRRRQCQAGQEGDPSSQKTLLRMTAKGAATAALETSVTFKRSCRRRRPGFAAASMRRS
jgi:hypothetical protein